MSGKHLFKLMHSDWLVEVSIKKVSGGRKILELILFWFCFESILSKGGRIQS